MSDGNVEPSDWSDGGNGSINRQLSTLNSSLAHPGDHHWRAVRLRRGAQSLGSGSLRWRHPELSCASLGRELRLAFYLPWLEIFCGLALIFRRLYSGALALLFALLLVFIGASIAAKARGIDISCGCFGHVSDQLSFAWHLVLVFALLAGVVALLKWDREILARRSSQSLALSSRPRRRRGTPQLLSGFLSPEMRHSSERCRGGAS